MTPHSLVVHHADVLVLVGPALPGRDDEANPKQVVIWPVVQHDVGVGETFRRPKWQGRGKLDGHLPPI